MIPKDKAKELYDKMYKNCTMTIAGASHIWKPLVKQQLLIVVDEILDAEMQGDVLPYGMEQIRFWQQVRIEIQKL